MQKEYLSILSENTTAVVNVNLNEPSKLWYGRYAYDIKVTCHGAKKSAHQYNIIQKTRNKLGTLQFKTETQEEQKEIIKALAHNLPKRAQYTTINVDVFAPSSKDVENKLAELSRKSSLGKINYTNGDKFRDKFSCKVSFKVKIPYDYRWSSTSRVEIFLKEFEILSNVMSAEQSSDNHAFTDEVWTTAQALAANSKISGYYIVPQTFTLYLKDEDCLSYLFFINQDVLKINSIEVRS